MEELSTDYLESKLIEQPITDFRDLQYFYGVIAVAAKGLSCDHAAYLTTFEPEEQENGLICIDFTWEQENNTLQFDQLTPQSFTNNNKELVEKVSYSSYSASNGSDHSITQKTPADPDINKIESYIEDTLQWVQKQTVQDVMKNNTNADLLVALNKVSKNNQLITTIKSQVKSIISDPQQCLITVRIKREGTERYKYAGEFDILVKALKERNKSKSISKTAFNVDSTGFGMSSISETKQELVGRPSDSLDTFKTKQRSTFYRLSPDENSWLSYPVSMEESLHWSASKELLDELYINIFNRRMYFIPYPSGKPTVKNAKNIYKDVNEFKSQGLATGISTVEKIGDNPFYVLSLTQKTEIYNIFGELQRMPKTTITRFGDEFIRKSKLILQTTNLFDTLKPNKNNQVVWRPRGIKQEDWTPTVTHLFDKTGNFNTTRSQIYRKIIYGTLISEVSVSETSDFNESDPLSELYWSILSEDKFSKDRLLKLFVEGLIEDESGRLGKTTQIYSQQTLFHQYALLKTLESMDMVHSDETGTSTQITEDLSNSNNVNINMGHSDLYDPINSTVQDTGYNKCEQYAFLAGTVVGYTAEHQSANREMNKTLINDHPISRITSSKIKGAICDSLDKAQMYGMYGKSDLGNLAREYEVSDDELSVASNDSLKYYYALGLSFGNSLFYKS